MGISLEQFRASIGSFYNNCSKVRNIRKIEPFCCSVFHFDDNFYSSIWLLQIVFYSLYKDIILLKANDVESNPGPSIEHPSKVMGTINQGADIFEDFSRGRQCIANSYVSMFFSYINQALYWRSSDIDFILHLGNTLYSTIPKTSSYLFPSDLPEYIKCGRQCFRLQLGESFSGVVSHELNILPNIQICMPLEKALKMALGGHYAFLCLETYGVALFIQHGTFYIFDSHSRDKFGLQHESGVAILMGFSSIDDLIEHIKRLADSLSAVQFEVTPAQVTPVTTDVLLEESFANIPHPIELHLSMMPHYKPIWFATDSLFSITICHISPCPLFNFGEADGLPRLEVSTLNTLPIYCTLLTLLLASVTAHGKWDKYNWLDIFSFGAYLNLFKDFSVNVSKSIYPRYVKCFEKHFSIKCKTCFYSECKSPPKKIFATTPYIIKFESACISVHKEGEKYISMVFSETNNRVIETHVNELNDITAVCEEIQRWKEKLDTTYMDIITLSIRKITKKNIFKH